MPKLDEAWEEIAQRRFDKPRLFTEAAQERNIEIGLLVRSRRIGEQIGSHFDTLLAATLLEHVL